MEEKHLMQIEEYYIKFKDWPNCENLEANRDKYHILTPFN